MFHPTHQTDALCLYILLLACIRLRSCVRTTAYISRFCCKQPWLHIVHQISQKLFLVYSD